MSAKAPKCAGCGRRIRRHHSDVEVLEVATGRRLLYHQECGTGAYRKVSESRDVLGVWGRGLTERALSSEGAG